MIKYRNNIIKCNNVYKKGEYYIFGKNNNKILNLIELVKEINILNLSLILAMIMSFFKINQYVIFIIVMLFAMILSNKMQKIIEKYLGNNKSLFQSKIYVIFAICLNAIFLVYYFLEKEYVLLILLIVFLVGYSLWTKIIYKRKGIGRERFGD